MNTQTALSLLGLPPLSPSLGTWFQRLFAGNDLVDGTLALIAILVGLLLGRIAAWFLGWLARRWEDRGWSAWQHMATGAIGPVGLWLGAMGFAVARAPLTLDPSVTRGWLIVVRLLASLALLWFALNMAALVEVVLRRVAGGTRSSLDENLAPLLRTTLRVVIVVVGSLFIANSVFGQPVGGWLAGLGIAGLAVSLAAQDSLKNLFGSITILADQPFRVGDRILCKGYDGTVEEIGFRSSKIRTASGHLVTIPNSIIVSEVVENAARRPFIARTFQLQLPADTTRARAERALSGIRQVLGDGELAKPIHPTVQRVTHAPRVALSELKPEGPVIQVSYWYAPPVQAEYLEHAERVNVRILEVLDAARQAA